MFGAVPLTDETSTQFTLGIAVQPTDTFMMTLDYYFIALDNRLWVSSLFPVSPAQRALLQALGIPGSETLAGVQFFINDMDTESSGFDLVATYNIDWSGGNTMLSLAANVNETKVTRRTDRQTDPANPDPVYYLADNDVFNIENGDPQYRVNFTGSHSWASDVTATVRANWYGDYTVTNRDMSITTDFNGKVYWDADVNWDINDTFSVTVGANNIFDTRPDAPPVPPFCCGRPVHSTTVMDWQGSHYYFRGSVRWN
jgi:iron complex outermembrane receptor protein